MAGVVAAVARPDTVADDPPIAAASIAEAKILIAEWRMGRRNSVIVSGQSAVVTLHDR